MEEFTMAVALEAMFFRCRKDFDAQGIHTPDSEPVRRQFVQGLFYASHQASMSSAEAIKRVSQALIREIAEEVALAA